MTRLINAADAFVDDMIDGFVSACSQWVRRAPGGVIRAFPPAEPTVSVVVGGGSGHYPAFAGLVGPGLAHGAAIGNVFASPSASQIAAVSRACDQGRGILFSYGNYAGDVLNFRSALQQLQSEGLDVRTVVVTDDIASAPPAELHRRRGIAGDLVVFKIAGAAAEAGLDLDEVERLARRANARTRSLGVAFSGCTLPGADAPLFEVPAGRMAIGLGIHGEPGIEETTAPTAHALAEMLVERLLEEAPSDRRVGGQRVALLLNGLGAVKSEELFVVYRSIAEALRARGIVVVDPEVGELCTSFDMAGCSLTLCWLDDELEHWWRAPADAPGFRKGRPAPAESAGQADADEVGGRWPAAGAESSGSVGVSEIPPASVDSRRWAVRACAAFDAIFDLLVREEPRLGAIDAVAGDGDHGIGMRRGAMAARSAAREAAEAGCGLGQTLSRAGAAWGDQAGGTSGAIWSCLLRAAGESLGDGGTPTAADVARAVTSASEAVISFGGAQVGEKTMVDAVVPFASALRAGVAAGRPLAVAWACAAAEAERAASATADIPASRGRARAHGSRSIGTPDPGAVSFALICSVIDADAPSTCDADTAAGSASVQKGS